LFYLRDGGPDIDIAELAFHRRIVATVAGRAAAGPHGALQFS
jgi:hypothetical protein